MKIDRSAIVATDASFCPESGSCGYAVLIQRPGRRPYRRSGTLDIVPATIQQAEEWAVKQGVMLAQQMGLRQITVFSDCKHVVTRLNTDRQPGVRYAHIKAHTNNINLIASMNRWCDRESRKVMRNIKRQLSL